MKTVLSLIFILIFSLFTSAATFTVTRSYDSNLLCRVDNCSLREAVNAANAAPGDDIIEFSTGGNIFLSGFEIQITSNISINGPGTRLLTISGGFTNNSSRIFYTSGNVTIRNLTLTNGNSNGGFFTGSGGAVLANGGSLLLSRVVIQNSTANNGLGGGGVSFIGGTNHRIENSSITNNTASACGGVRVDSTSISINNSTVSDNTSLETSNRTSTGGGLCFLNASATVRNSTIASNRSLSTSLTASQAGGIVAGDSSISFGNTIIAGNFAQTYPEIAQQTTNSITSAGFNLIGDSPGDAANTQNPIAFQSTDIRDTSPLLGELRNNGGTTLTRALLTGSPAIDMGFRFVTDTDQRGLPRPVDNPNVPNAAGGDSSDIGAVELGLTTLVPNRKLFDFDGDNRDDISVFRPSNGTWYRINSSNNTFYAVQFGFGFDQIAPADYDGDGKTDIAVFRGLVPGAGDLAYFYILNSSDNSFRAVQFGQRNDLPVPGDYDGDGKADVAVWRFSSIGGQSNFSYRSSSMPNVNFNQVFGSGGRPVVGDFDGDGKLDPALVMSSGLWSIRKSSDETFLGINFGLSSDIPVPADYDGDGVTNVAVFRPSTGTWYTSANAATNYGAIQFGASDDLPVPADYDGDGKADVGVFRPSNGVWYLNRTTSGFIGIQFGVSGDKPVPNAYIR
jgi:hypothetical protein